jgi:hypothetical protein
MRANGYAFRSFLSKLSVPSALDLPAQYLSILAARDSFRPPKNL